MDPKALVARMEFSLTHDTQAILIACAAQPVNRLHHAGLTKEKSHTNRQT